MIQTLPTHWVYISHCTFAIAHNQLSHLARLALRNNMQLVNALHFEKSLKKLTHQNGVLANKTLSYAERNCTYFYTGIGNFSEDMLHTTTLINHINRSS